VLQRAKNFRKIYLGKSALDRRISLSRIIRCRCLRLARLRVVERTDNSGHASATTRFGIGRNEHIRCTAIHEANIGRLPMRLNPTLVWGN